MGSTVRVPHHDMLEVKDLPPVTVRPRHGRGHLLLVSTFGRKAAGARALDALIDALPRRRRPSQQEVEDILLAPAEPPVRAAVRAAAKKAGRKRR